jgi:hypothetical protein
LKITELSSTPECQEAFFSFFAFSCRVFTCFHSQVKPQTQSGLQDRIDAIEPFDILQLYRGLNPTQLHRFSRHSFDTYRMTIATVRIPD